MFKLGYGIVGEIGTKFQVGLETQDAAMSFLKDLGLGISYAFLVDEAGEATDLNSKVVA